MTPALGPTHAAKDFRSHTDIVHGATRSEVSTHQIRLFLALAEELHFGRAAARLCMTQPALSRQIQALERRLGVPLFVREGRAVRLSDAGHALRGEAQAVVDATHRLREKADQWVRTLTGHLVVGTFAAESAMPYAQPILRNLRTRHPHLSIEVRTSNVTCHLTQLLEGRVDVAFLRPPVPAGVQLLRLSSEPRVACVSADDPLAGRDSVSVTDFAGHTFPDYPPQIPRPWRNHWAEDPRPDGTPVRYGPVFHDLEDLLLAIARGEVVSFIPEAARRLFPRPGVRYLDVIDLSPCTSALGWLAAHGDRPVVAAAREAAASWLRSTAL
ncbi:LysR substrate-binding domain-containing protein [Sphaerisporangium dianthi]|uniref:LysR substrate-binding domain-containing protein n=1 Tax=Sphaerisporangium dianthi TaxID=1436120 RepID=A0ABV9CGM9_9ACTN